jgi:glycosyltransferase involved in cell wall biosynthesis
MATLPEARRPVGIDGSVLEAARWSGVERAAARLALALAVAGETVLLFSRREVRWPLPSHDRLRFRVVPGRGPLAAWREAKLPAALAAAGVRLLLSPVAAVPLLTRLPRVAVIHELPWLRRPRAETGRTAAVHRLRILAAARACRLLLVPSEVTARDLATLAPGAARRIAVLPWGVDATFVPGPPPGRLALPAGPKVLWVGTVRRRKALPVLLAAWRALPAPRPALLLAGVAEGDRPPEAGVRLLGFRNDEDLLELYRAADLLVCPSVSEGFGFPVLEAMACGCPVIAADAGSVPEVCAGAALLVPPRDTVALTAALRRALGDAELRRVLSENGIGRAAAFTWARTGERARDLLAEAVP